jgi:hypothetical protein
MSAHRFAGRKIFVFCACCSKACYECLLNFHNQREHEKLDRNLVLPVLRKLEKVEITKRVSQSSDNRLDELLKKCESEFERSVLVKMGDAKLPLPDEAQYIVYDGDRRVAKPDFFYRSRSITVFVDGPPHDKDYKMKDDEQKRKSRSSRHRSVYLKLLFSCLTISLR